MSKQSSYDGFTEDERAAMKERAAELKASKRRGSGSKKAEADKQDLLDKIAEMPDDEREIAEALHAIVGEHAPELAPKTWYGMPAYANKDGKAVVFFKYASKFKMRYSEIGFNEQAQLDDGDFWPTVYAVTAMNDDIKTQLTELVKRSVG